MKKKNMVIIGVIALILVVAVGYAIFSDTLTINGSATAKGDFSLSYECNISDDSNNKENDSCEVKGNEVITKSVLSKPTDQESYEITITNTGTIPAILKEVQSPNNYNQDGSDTGDEMYVNTENLLGAVYYGIQGEDDSTGIWGDSAMQDANITLQPGEKLKIAVIHTWVDSDMMSLESQPELPAEGATLTYNLKFKFQQVEN